MSPHFIDGQYNIIIVTRIRLGKTSLIYLFVYIFMLFCVCVSFFSSFLFQFFFNFFFSCFGLSPYLGQVWPGPTYFPDFINPRAQSYWTTQLKEFHNQVAVDGIWIDMNEISNFCNVDGKGQVCANSDPKGCPAPGASQTDCCLVCSTPDKSNTLDFPPYAIGNVYGSLATKTVAMSATHYKNISVYDAHNLYGLSEQIATNVALTEVYLYKFISYLYPYQTYLPLYLSVYLSVCLSVYLKSNISHCHPSFMFYSVFVIKIIVIFLIPLLSLFLSLLDPRKETVLVVS